ncbi:uncharacterized protein B0I36DRAFT_327039 [Microdochium trichocladiopsis]|uniref:Uncharacterized protein n=1 Tax=Microdochium trichocladiopsis TaxID=1682393 RepID=A0A9P8Y212_9PEZI|nr:uncharacterized protein B0I36DRAFT_327039 [Microdochium trichocladiopsis]KAH7027409.1 hypothetical protein B0I36DRAFT_327039 [Microdochium trichocladiopsis]
MPKGHHRSRSSIDRTLDLLADLDDGQLELLLQEANSSGDAHVAVAQAITLFERPLSPPLSPRSSMLARGGPQAPRKFLTSLSPRKGSLRRRTSNRTSSAPEPRTPKSPKRTSFILAKNASANIDVVLAAEEDPIPTTTTTAPSSMADADKAADQPPPTPKSPRATAPPVSSPKTTSSSTKTSRAYKRISRPFPLLSPGSFDGSNSTAGTPQIHDLLAAYFLEGSTAPALSSSGSSTDGSSPITPRSFSSPFAASPSVISWAQAEAEGPDSPWEDVFEPSPSRRRGPAAAAAPFPTKPSKGQKSYGDNLGLGFGMSPMREPSRNISGIFEVLGPI